MRSQLILKGVVVLAGSISISRGLAEDPVVVRYSDPGLTRLEKEVGVTPAQKDRFDDIVVKYRDQSYLNGESNSNSGGTDGETGASPRAGGGGKGGGHRRGGGGTAFTSAKGANLRQELDELATVLRSEQLKKFEDLAHHRDKHEHPSS